jgi:hypothetical protein
MLVEFNHRYRIWQAGKRKHLGKGIAVELIKRKIVKEVTDELPPSGRKTKRRSKSLSATNDVDGSD